MRKHFLPVGLAGLLLGAGIGGASGRTSQTRAYAGRVNGRCCPAGLQPEPVHRPPDRRVHPVELQLPRLLAEQRDRRLHESGRRVWRWWRRSRLRRWRSRLRGRTRLWWRWRRRRRGILRQKAAGLRGQLGLIRPGEARHSRWRCPITPASGVVGGGRSVVTRGPLPHQ